MLHLTFYDLGLSDLPQTIQTMAPATILKRPGFGLPLSELPAIYSSNSGARFPTLLNEEWSAATLTIREVFILWVVEQITNKPSWNTKVFDEEILAKWKAELEQAPWKEATGFEDGGPCSQQMWDHVSPASIRSCIPCRALTCQDRLRAPEQGEAV